MQNNELAGQYPVILTAALVNNLYLSQVDLAGSENVGRSGAVDKRLREAGMKSKLLH